MQVPYGKETELHFKGYDYYPAFNLDTHQMAFLRIHKSRITYRRIEFEDNAGVLVTDDGDPKGTSISGPIAREAADLWPRISNVASLII